jgi:trimethylamine--corrinoid protein Co-methyltransferase
MTARGFIPGFEPLTLLNEEQVEAVHHATLEVLEKTGVRFESRRAMELFERHDCAVDYQEHRVRFPRGLIEECLSNCPSSFRLRAWKPENDVLIGGESMYCAAFPGMRAIDLETWEERMPTIEDNHDAVKVLDRLENVHLSPSYTPYCELEDVAPAMLLPVSCWSRMKYFTKPSRIGSSMESHIFEIQMAQALDVDVFAAMEAAPPLSWYTDAIDCAWACAENGYPVEVGCGAVMGATGPATIAGSMVTGNAEIMSGLAMVQLIRPGTGILANSFVFAQNMRTGAPVFGGVETNLYMAMFNQMWRQRYDIPTMHGGCGPTDAHRIDFQAGYEKGIGAVLAAVSGSSVINVPGGIHGELTYHPVQSVLDNDMIGAIGRFLEGVLVTEETLAVDVINEVGPIPGNFLTTAHTREWWSREQYVPRTADRSIYSTWVKQGKKSALDHAKERVEEILATYEPPLGEEKEQELDRILEEAKQYYQSKGML